MWLQQRGGRKEGSGRRSWGGGGGDEGGCCGAGGGQAGEVCARLHYPADLVMTAGAQEERSGRG